MKARVKATRKVVSLVNIERHKLCGSTDEVFYIYQDDSGNKYTEEELDFQDIFDYWTRLEHQYAGMAMQGLMSYIEQVTPTEGSSYCDAIVDFSYNVAHALVEKYKKEEKK